MKLAALLVVAAVAVTAVSFANGASPDPTGHASKRGKRGLRGFQGPPGPQGAQGPQGAPGIASVAQVDGPEISYPPGSYGASADAVCPSGSTVIGTGFNGPFGAVGGFVKAYGSFVGGFFINESSVTVTGNVQAICGRVSGRVRRSVAGRVEYAADVAEAAKLVEASR